jgi:hypothetical protein
LDFDIHTFQSSVGLCHWRLQCFASTPGLQLKHSSLTTNHYIFLSVLLISDFFGKLTKWPQPLV